MSNNKRYEDWQEESRGEDRGPRRSGVMPFLLAAMGVLCLIVLVVAIHFLGGRGTADAGKTEGGLPTPTSIPETSAPPEFAVEEPSAEEPAAEVAGEQSPSPAQAAVTTTPVDPATPTPAPSPSPAHSAVTTAPRPTPAPTPEPLSMWFFSGSTGQLTQRSFTSASATSFLSDKQYGDFPASQAIDGRTDTSWQEGVEGLGEGESITLWFDGPTSVSVLRIFPGFTRDETTFRLNGKPCELRFAFSTGESCTIVLENSFGGKDLALSRAVTTTYVKITILSVYDSESRWKDTAISEVIAFG